MTDLLNQPWLFSFFFVSLWCAICLLLSRLSGWASLAAFYACSEDPKGEKYSHQSINLGFIKFPSVSYGNCVTMHLSADTLFVKVMPIFRLGHRSLCIPMKDIEAQTGRVLFFKTVDITFKEPGTIKMRAYRGFGEALLKAKNTPSNSI